MLIQSEFGFAGEAPDHQITGRDEHHQAARSSLALRTILLKRKTLDLLAYHMQC
jgi:hypothetical protein